MIEGINTELLDLFLGGFVLGLGLAILVVLFSALYIYYSWAWMRIAKKMKHKYSWLAWIPLARGAMILQLGGFNWAWIFLVLIPVFGWLALFVLWIISSWRIFEARNYPGWFSLSVLIPQAGWVLYLIAIGFVAWADKKKR